MSIETVGIGIIGCGTISDVYLGNFTKNIENVKVVACADLYAEKAEKTKERYHLPKTCTVDELIADPEVQIVVNLTIPAVHYEVNMKALQAGKHVYCEKPLALRLEEANEIMKLADEKNLMAVSAPDTFLGAGAQTCRKILDEDTLGRAIGFTANMVCPGHELWHPAPAFYYKKGGGPMFDMGPYYITTLVFLFGPIKKIACFTTSGSKTRSINGKQEIVETPTHYAGIMEFVNGAVGNVNMSFDVWDSTLPLLEVYGTKGSMCVPDPNMYAGPIRLYEGERLKTILEAVTEPHPAKIMTMISRKCECAEDVELKFPVDSDLSCNMRGIGVSDMAQAILDKRQSRLSCALSRHVVEALNAFEISSVTNSVYEMTTTCERPEPMPEKSALWQVK